MAKWHHKYRIEWDAADGRNGGAQCTVWEILLEMEKFTYHAGEKYQGAVAKVLDQAEAFERVSLPVVCSWATHFNLLKKIMRVLCWVLRSSAACSVRRMSGAAAPDYHGHSSWVKVSCLLLRIVLWDALGEVTKFYPASEAEGFCG